MVSTQFVAKDDLDVEYNIFQSIEVIKYFNILVYDTVFYIDSLW